MLFSLAVDEKQMMSRFLQLRGVWVREVTLTAVAVIDDA